MSRGQGNFSYTAVPSPSESLSGKLLHQTSDSVSETLSDMLSTDESNSGVSSADLNAWDPDAARLLKVVDNESLEGLKALLVAGVHINGHGGSFHETALHRAAQLRWTAGLSYLLSAGASVYAKNQFGQTPLHYAAASQSTACIKLLLSSGRPGVVDHRDMRGHTPLHDASASGCVEAIAVLLKAGALVRAKDANGETPLHKAAKARSIPSMVALLNAGADLAAVDDNGESVLSYILHHLPGTMDAVFDHCLVTNSPKINTKTLEVSLNFLPLTCSFEKNQVQNLQSFVDMGQAKLLSHPLCEAFLLLKWMNVRRLFLIEVVFYFIYATLTTILTFNKFVWTTSHTNVSELVKERGEDWKEWGESHVQGEWGLSAIPDKAEEVLKGLVIFQTVLILLQQLLSLMQNKLAWFRSLSGILHVMITLLVLLVVPFPVPAEWQHHLATWMLLLMWTECMVLIGRFPNCGIYVVMFTRVAKVFVRIFAIYFCLLLAFSSAFYVALHYAKDSGTGEQENQVFTNPVLTFTKTLTMMIGELDFGDDFVVGLSHLVATGHIIFLFFVILVSIILSNLLVALAVNDVQGLRNSAHLERLIKQTELVFQMEKNFSTASYLGSHIKIPKLREMLTKVSYICKHDCYNSRAFLLPNHPKKANRLYMVENKKCVDVALPSFLKTNIIECLRARETESADSKGSVRARKGSRIRRGEYHRNEQQDLKVSIKELEANVAEIMSEKVDEITETYGALAKRITTLEENLEKLINLLSKNTNGENPNPSQTE
ncbi:transient receptor potential channel pyrexia [Penaeus vannamei]|uniref:transient receptor potential channel pyrexia n=1 Tax=Penaeus vannamei TaxID=6689 RepID=UPI000F66AF16|nr:transient receptor potential channel pyrexia-like [Penaeus vannamei]XP_027231577.1 transient receptor potential channel pyrexia-like [Penaeus vannamei]